jgi:type IV pilus assembly protein PilE
MKINGFTLVELMVTVAVLAIIASIAYPSYREQMRKTYRSEAKAALMDAATRAERHYTQFGNYGGTIPIPTTTENGYYTLNLVAATTASPQTFTITATRAGTQVADKCGNFSIDQAQTKSVAGGSLSAAQCW